MSESAQRRTNICGFLAILLLSSMTMLWLFWHYPVKTALVTLVVLSGLGISARLARWVDNDGRSDMEPRNHTT